MKRIAKLSQMFDGLPSAGTVEKDKVLVMPEVYVEAGGGSPEARRMAMKKVNTGENK